MASDNKQDKQTSLRLPSAVHDHLSKIAEEEGLKLADVIRRAIRLQYPMPKKDKGKSS